MVFAIQKLSRLSNGEGTDYQTLLRFDDTTIEYGYNAKPFEIRNFTNSGILRFGYAIYSSFASNVDYEWYVIDLEQRYGNSAVVNAIIGNDSSKYVERLLKFDSNILKNIAYNAGSFSKCKSAKLKSTKLNIWDEVAEVGSINPNTGVNEESSTVMRSKNYIRVIGGQTYYGCVGNIITSGGARWYDANKNFISQYDADGNSGIFNAVHKAPLNACYLRFVFPSAYGTTYNHDICINFHYDGSRDGEYEASDIMYVDLPNKDLNGILKVDGDGNVYADGDELYPNGGGNSKRYDIVDLGTLDWQKSTNYIYADLSNAKAVNSSIPNIRTEYTGIEVMAMDTLSVYPYPDGITVNNNSKIFIRDTRYNDLDDLIAALNGKHLIYELATPQELSASTFDANIYQDDFGLTQVLDEDDNELNGLQGFEIFYKANIAAFTEMIYNKTEGDSDNLALKSDLTDFVKTHCHSLRYSVNNESYAIRIFANAFTPTKTSLLTFANLLADMTANNYDEIICSGAVLDKTNNKNMVAIRLNMAADNPYQLRLICQDEDGNNQVIILNSFASYFNNETII